MKRVTGWLEIERQLTPNHPWITNMQFPEDFSIEQGRNLLERLIPTLPETKYRLVYVRVETTREVLE